MKNMVDYNKIIENDFEKTLYEKKYQEIKKYLLTFGSSSFFDIVSSVGGSERRMMRLLDQMIINGDLVVKNNKFNLKNNKNKYQNINFKYITKMIKKIYSIKPTPSLLFDQRPVTYKTTVNRVKYMLDRNDVYNKNIVFLGDDDLTSIALALTKVKCQITVLDIDKRLIDFINKISKEYNLNINAKVFNALDETPSSLLHKFDVFLTDPTPEKIPFTVFMNKGVSLLKENEDSIIYTSIYSSAMEETLDLQKVICNMNLYITDMIPNFTKYQAIYKLYRQDNLDFIKKYNIKINEDSICFTETLFRMKITKDTKTLKITYKGEDIFGKATKRVINNQDSDVTDYDNYMQKMINNIKSSSLKKYNSK